VAQTQLIISSSGTDQFLEHGSSTRLIYVITQVTTDQFSGQKIINNDQIIYWKKLTISDVKKFI
jgi:hypothetical protein